MWLEHLASHAPVIDAYSFSFHDDELDFRPLLDGMIRDRLRGRDKSEIGRAFQRGIAEGLRDAVATLCRTHGVDTAVLSGGVFQNELLLNDLSSLLEPERLQIWTNHVVPSNDGGISLGQAALAALTNPESGASLDETGSAWMAHVT
jgi:hydrogenase maturation protein HypF